MFNNKEIKKLKKKISKVEDKVPDEYAIRAIAEEAVEESKDELRELYKERAKAKQEAWDFMRERIDVFATEYIKQLIDEKVKDIQDKLIVELARKAMNMEEK